MLNIVTLALQLFSAGCSDGMFIDRIEDGRVAVVLCAADNLDVDMMGSSLAEGMTLIAETDTGLACDGQL